MSESTGVGRRVTLDRDLDGPLEDVWELWTTKAGFESWWGPDGFSVEVFSIDLRPGGELDYAMTAHEAGQVDFLRKAGMPATTRHVLVFTEVVPLRNLAYLTTVDFIPGVRPYRVATSVDFTPTADGVRMQVTFDAMHDAHWTNLASAGWASQLGKLATALAARAG